MSYLTLKQVAHMNTTVRLTYMQGSTGNDMTEEYKSYCLLCAWT
jgi:hypothetical protein